MKRATATNVERRERQSLLVETAARMRRRVENVVTEECAKMIQELEQKLYTSANYPSVIGTVQQLHNNIVKALEQQR